MPIFALQPTEYFSAQDGVAFTEDPKKEQLARNSFDFQGRKLMRVLKKEWSIKETAINLIVIEYLRCACQSVVSRSLRTPSYQLSVFPLHDYSMGCKLVHGAKSLEPPTLYINLSRLKLEKGHEKIIENLDLVGRRLDSDVSGLVWHPTDTVSQWVSAAQTIATFKAPPSLIPFTIITAILPPNRTCISVSALWNMEGTKVLFMWKDLCSRVSFSIQAVKRATSLPFIHPAPDNSENYKRTEINLTDESRFVAILSGPYETQEMSFDRSNQWQLLILSAITSSHNTPQYSDYITAAARNSWLFQMFQSAMVEWPS